MGLRFRRKIKIGPGITLNIGKTGISTSIGTRGAHVTIGKNGTRTTLGIPGTGLSYSSLTKSNSSDVYVKNQSWRCLKCGHKYKERLPHFCVECANELTFTSPKEYPKEYPAEIKKYLDGKGCIYCRKCHRPILKARDWNYKCCPNCGTVLPVPELTFSNVISFFMGHFILTLIWTIAIVLFLWIGYCLIKAAPLLIGFLIFGPLA